MSTCRLSFQWASTINIQWSVLFWFKADLMSISSKCDMFLPWYILTCYSLGVKERHSLTQWYFELFWRCITVYILLFPASNRSSTICFYPIVLLIILVFCVEFFILLVFVLWLLCPIFPVSVDSPLLVTSSLFSSIWDNEYGICHYGCTMDDLLSFSLEYVVYYVYFIYTMSTTDFFHIWKMVQFYCTRSYFFISFLGHDFNI
jgi:hypothetical protein